METSLFEIDETSGYRQDPTQRLFQFKYSQALQGWLQVRTLSEVDDDTMGEGHPAMQELFQ